jgi:kumamolisin
MKWFSKKKAGLLCGLVLGLGLIGGLMYFRTGESPFSGKHFTLHGNTPPALLHAIFHKHADTSRQFNFVIGLKLKNEAELDALIKRQSDPASPDYRKFITPQEFAQRFGPEHSRLEKLLKFLSFAKLKALNISTDGQLVHVQGSCQAIEEAFKVTMNLYRLNHQDHFSIDRDPQLPAELSDVVDSVVGLHDFTQLKSHEVRAGAEEHSSVPTGYGPKDVATAYNFPNANNSKPGAYSGKGVTIGIATAYTYDPKDVEGYWKQYGVNRTGTVTNVYVNGKATQLNPETTLDLQQIGAQAPGANIRMYLGHDAGLASFALVFHQIVTENQCSIVSVSWGMCEPSTAGFEMRLEHRLFKQAAAQGISFFVAAGDDGAYDCRGNSGTDYSVDYSSSDDNVTAVGGTALKIGKDGKRTSESAWVGAGGGVSTKFSRPDWQKGGGLPDNDKRNTSDVSLVADPATGYSTLYQGKWVKAGGTSFAAPNWAALWGLCEEAAGVGRLGPANPTVYRLATSKDYSTVFFDVVDGNNGNNKGPGFATNVGWDHPTGWGTPDGSQLANWLKNERKVR